MATTQDQGSMPLVELPTGFVVQFEAISPTTGAAVAGVTVSSVSLAVDGQGKVEQDDLQIVAPFFTFAEITGAA